MKSSPETSCSTRSTSASCSRVRRSSSGFTPPSVHRPRPAAADRPLRACEVVGLSTTSVRARRGRDVAVDQQRLAERRKSRHVVRHERFALLRPRDGPSAPLVSLDHDRRSTSSSPDDLRLVAERRVVRCGREEQLGRVVGDDRVREPPVGLVDLGERLPDRDELDADASARRGNLWQPARAACCPASSISISNGRRTRGPPRPTRTPGL